jgi:putative ABC transport system permease protein
MSSLNLLLFSVLVVLCCIGLLVMRRRTLAKMSVRNIIRKRKFTVIITAGLLIATAMISGALVMADTLNYIIKKDTYDSTGAVDIIVSAKDYTGKNVFFDESIGQSMSDLIAAGNMTYVDGLSPAIRESVAVLDVSTSLPYPSATLFAVDLTKALNPLLDEEKDTVSVDDISNQNVVINQALADELNAKVGDQILVSGEMGVPQPATISHIAYDTGLARWLNDRIVFVDLEYAQTYMFFTSMVNMLDVSCMGSVSSGYKVTDQAETELATYLPGSATFEFSSIKSDGIEVAETTSDQISQLFVIMSSFTIIAGIALIVNIFVMLAEERKPEMGISRAIGMQRGDLTQTFVFEGAVYAVMAAVSGAFVGLLIAGVMMGLFSSVLGGSLAFTLHFNPQSLVIAGCAGFLITLLTVTVSAWRVSRLNIVRAIRDIPEPDLAKSWKKYFASGILITALGVLMLAQGASSKQGITIDSGPSLILIGLSTILIRYVHPRWPFTVSGAIIIWWVLDPTNFKDILFGTVSGGMEMFLVSGTLLVIGGVMIAMFNSDILLLGLTKLAKRRRSLLPVFKTAISYPMNKKFRTGLSLFIFALIMFTVTVLAMIASFQRESVDATTQQFSGGFELMGISMKDINSGEFQTGVQDLVTSGDIDRIEPSLTAPIAILQSGENESVPYSLLGMTPSMLDENKFSLAARSEEYATDQEAWSALETNSSVAIIDGTVLPQMYGPSFGIIQVDIDETITLVMADGHPVQVRIIGIMDQVMNMAVVTSNDFILNNSGVVNHNLFYVSTTKQASLTDNEIADDLEKRFVQYGLRVYVARDMAKNLLDTISSMMQLMEVFLGMGLIVGISGLGIITMRSVAERRQEIGVMRSIGFQRDMILKTFLLETSFVSLLGIAIGVVLGLALSYRLWDWGGFAKNAAFVIPWGEILLLIAIAFVITLAATLPPSRSASKLAPAEALRRVD